MTPEQRQKLELIRQHPAKLEATVKNLTEEQLDTPCGEGEWTVRQVVHHLADSHMNSVIRLKLILTEEHPTLRAYDQEQWATLIDSKLPLDATFSILHGLHQRWTTLFENLSDDDWRRTGYHPESGNVTPDDLLTIYARHGEEHIEQIKRVLETGD